MLVRWTLSVHKLDSFGDPIRLFIPGISRSSWFYNITMAPFDGFAPSDGVFSEMTSNTQNGSACTAAVTQSTLSTLAPSAATPYEIYDGGFESGKARGICIRIANGTAGQIGFVRAWADNFIQHMVKKGEDPFLVRSILFRLRLSSIQPLIFLVNSFLRLLGIWEIPLSLSRFCPVGKSIWRLLMSLRRRFSFFIRVTLLREHMSSATASHW